MVSEKEAPDLGEHLEEVLGSGAELPYLDWEMFSQVIRGLQKLGYLLMHTQVWGGVGLWVPWLYKCQLKTHWA